MAERSKAPDSRIEILPMIPWERAFWSPNGGVGSNPTSDTVFFLFSNRAHNFFSFVLNKDV